MGRPPLKKGAIERAALELFVEKGVDGTSIRDIAQRAGVTEGALYRHHKSKDDLVRHLYVQSFAHFADIMEGLADKDTPARKRIKDFIDALVALHAKDSYVFRYVLVLRHVLLKEVRVGEQDVAAALTAAVGGSNGKLTAQLILGQIIQVTTAVEDGLLPSPLSSHANQLNAAAASLLG